MKPTLLVLAAGMGSRFGGLKQMEPVGPSGEWILDYSVHDAIEAGFGKVVFVIRREMESVFRPIVESKYGENIDVEIAFQEMDDLPIDIGPTDHRQKPWGTGHAVFAARKKLDTPFAVINADDFYGKESYGSLANFLSTTEDNMYALVGYRLDKTLSPNGSVSRGVCQADENGLLANVEEHTSIALKNGLITGENQAGKNVTLSAETPVSLNCWAFPRAFLIELKQLFEEFLKRNSSEAKTEFYLPFAVDELVKSNTAQVRILRCEADWLGVTHREDLLSVQNQISKMVQNGDYPSPLSNDA
ncbi:MAG: sugar phosphate nucleotidyltransferase [Verrucomicrobiota bacterium]